MASPSSAAGAEPRAEAEQGPSFLGELIKGVSAALGGEPLSPEEEIAARLKAGEGVVWSADYSRIWRSKNGMPQEELTLEEGRLLAEELSIPLPAELDAPSDPGTQPRGGSPRMGFADWGKSAKVATASHILVASREEALKIKEKIEGGRVSFADAAEMFSTCGTATEGGSLGSFAPGEMVKEFDDFCFDPETPLDTMGVVDTEFGTHLVRVEKRFLGQAEEVSFRPKTYRMLDTPDPRTGLRS